MTIVSDDIGSFPLPAGAVRQEVEKTALEISTGDCGEDEKKNLNRIVADIMQIKIDSGIMCPNYPQIHDMIASFFALIEKFYEEDEPWVVKREFARVPEIPAIDLVAKKYFESTGNFLPLRVCVTGPLELYLKNVGASVEGDLLINLAKSISRFVENSILDKEYVKTRVVCIDEPSLGLNSNLIADDEDLIKAWEISAGKAKHLDVQVHLHSTKDMDKIYQVDDIGIVGIESGEDPDILDTIDRDELESHDKFLRVGISRTNIYAMTAEFNERFGVDMWAGKNFDELLTRMETTEVIGARLKKAYELFGDRILYAGPDCGLKSWPSQEIAAGLLRNTTDAVDNFNKDFR